MRKKNPLLGKYISRSQKCGFLKETKTKMIGRPGQTRPLTKRKEANTQRKKKTWLAEEKKNGGKYWEKENNPETVIHSAL